MGREIRRVPPNWQHPKTKRRNYATDQYEECYKPLYDNTYIDALNEWIENHNEWERGTHRDFAEHSDKHRYYAQWAGNPPRVDYYRPKWAEGEATWFQVYETVTEGTPVTPPFATREELVDYLVANGDLWDQQRRARGSEMPCDPWPRKQAEAFVFGDGRAPSLIISGGTVKTGVEAIYA